MQGSAQGARPPQAYLVLQGKQPPRDRDARGRRGAFGPPVELAGLSGMRGLQT